MKRSSLALLVVGLLVLASAGWAIAARLQARKTDDAGTAKFEQMAMPMPNWLKSADAGVKETYIWAAVHQEELQYIPCYCGCGQMHDSNAACFFKRREDGTIADYDSHALNCQICVEIARSVRQGLAQGKTLSAIRQQIDKTYQARGLVATNTPMPPAGK